MHTAGQAAEHKKKSPPTSGPSSANARKTKKKRKAAPEGMVRHWRYTVTNNGNGAGSAGSGNDSARRSRTGRRFSESEVPPMEAFMSKWKFNPADQTYQEDAVGFHTKHRNNSGRSAARTSRSDEGLHNNKTRDTHLSPTPPLHYDQSSRRYARVSPRGSRRKNDPKFESLSPAPYRLPSDGFAQQQHPHNSNHPHPSSNHPHRHNFFSNEYSQSSLAMLTSASMEEYRRATSTSVAPKKVNSYDAGLDVITQQQQQHQQQQQQGGSRASSRRSSLPDINNCGPIPTGASNSEGHLHSLAVMVDDDEQPCNVDVPISSLSLHGGGRQYPSMRYEFGAPLPVKQEKTKMSLSSLLNP